MLDGTTEVAGLDATAVRTTKKIDGKEDEETRFYAQDDDGNVWVVGVESASGLSWQAGEDTTDAEAGLAMPAHPRLGDGWLTFRLPHLLEPSTTVEDQTRERVQTSPPAGRPCWSRHRRRQSGRRTWVRPSSSPSGLPQWPGAPGCGCPGCGCGAPH